MSENIEVRHMNIELRSVEAEDRVELIGYPVLFNTLSNDLGGFKEKINKNAFTKSLETSDVRALFEHNPQKVLGRESAGTLKLESRTKGIEMIVKPPNTGWALDLLTSIERGDINQMSFGFKVIDDSFTKEDEVIIRTIKEANIRDVSIVSFPAYPETKVALRSLEQWKEEQNREITNPELEACIERLKNLNKRLDKWGK